MEDVLHSCYTLTHSIVVKVFHPVASSTQKKLHRNFKFEKQHSLGSPNPYMEPSPTIKTKRSHALSESQTPVTNSSFIYIPPEVISDNTAFSYVSHSMNFNYLLSFSLKVLSRMRETSMGQKTQSAEEEFLHVPGFVSDITCLGNYCVYVFS